MIAQMISHALSGDRGEKKGAYGGKVIQCGICADSSATVRWYLEAPTTKDGVTVLVPVELLCMTCGSALEAWPLESDTPEKRSKLIHRYHHDLKFKLEVDLVRKGAAILQARLFGTKCVDSERSSEVSVKLRAALVETDMFKTLFKQKPEDVPGVTCVKLEGPFDTPVEGALLSFQDLPPSAKHFEVEIAARLARKLTTTQLAPHEVLRADQPKERYELSCRAFKESMVQRKLTVESVRDCMHHGAVLAAAAAKDASVKAEEQNRLANRGTDEAAVAAPMLLSRSRLDDDDHGAAAPAQPPAKKRRGSGGGMSAGSASGAAAKGLSSALASASGGGCLVLSTEPGKKMGNRGKKKAGLEDAEEIEQILLGTWAPGRTTRALRDKILEAKFMDEQDEANTKGRYAVHGAAIALAMKGLNKVAWEDARTYSNTLAIHGYELPVCHRMALASKCAVFNFDGNRMGKFFSAIDPTTSTPWSIDEPTFGSAWGDGPWNMDATGAGTEGVDSKDEKPAKDISKGHAWFEAVFSNPWLRLFNLASGADSEPLLRWSIGFAQWYDSQDRSKWHPRFLEYGVTAVSVARAFVALLSPVPDLCNSTLSDVDFVNTVSGSKASVVEAMPHVGRTIVSRLRKQDKGNTFWTTKLSEYRRSLGPAQEVKGEFLKINTVVQALADDVKAGRQGDEDDDRWDEALASIRLNLPDWQQNLRTGATTVLEQNIDCILRSDIAALQDEVASGGTQHEQACSLLGDFFQEYAKLLLGDLGTNLSQLCSSLALKYTQEQKYATVNQCLAAVQSEQSRASIAALADSLDGAWLDLPADLQTELQAVMDRVVLPWLEKGGDVSYASLVGLIQGSKTTHAAHLEAIASKLGDLETCISSSAPAKRIAKAFQAAATELAAPRREDAFIVTAKTALQTMKDSFLPRVTADMESALGKVIKASTELHAWKGVLSMMSPPSSFPFVIS